ncbi:hypothetical protein [Peribacillus sp. Bi134]|uniref:hypothetical protein n=1 Tax=Peribacillus sp. Bi134 TaxID=2884272 RepID=UPI001E5FFF3F|nr:hypothetical protein [Peribacillus sp. Bi134]
MNKIWGDVLKTQNQTKRTSASGYPLQSPRYLHEKGARVRVGKGIPTSVEKKSRVINHPLYKTTIIDY